MKKIFYTIAAAALMVGCAQEEFVDNSTNVEEGGSNVLYSDLGGSRVAIDGLNLSWTEGDDFAAFEGTKSNKYTLTAGQGTANGTFTGSGNPTFAVFPYNSKTTYDGAKVTITLPNSYKVNQNSSNTPMYGEIVDKNVQFTKKLTALLKVQFKNLPAGYNTLRVQAEFDNNSDKPEMKGGLSGTFTFTPGNTTLTPVKPKNYVTIAHENNTDPFYVPVLGIKHPNALTFSVENAEGHSITVVTLLDKTFEAGKMYSLDVEYNTILALYDQSNFVTVSTADLHKDAVGKWYGINNKRGSVEADAEGIKLIGNPSDPVGTGNYLGCTGGYCFPTIVNKTTPIYKVTYTVRSEKVGTGSENRMGFCVGAASIPTDVTVPEKPKTVGFYGYAYRAEYLSNLTPGAEQKVQGTFDPNKVEWVSNSVYVDFSKWALNNNQGVKLQSTDYKNVTSFEVRIWPQTGKTLWVKEIQISPVYK